jgi:predicted DNA-binding transcriptional regulator AlpA
VPAKPISTDAAPASHVPQLVSQPWAYCGVSRSAFYRLLSADKAPSPVSLPGSRPRWRRSDLDRWIASLKPARHKTKPLGMSAT